MNLLTQIFRRSPGEVVRYNLSEYLRQRVAALTNPYLYSPATSQSYSVGGRVVERVENTYTGYAEAAYMSDSVVGSCMRVRRDLFRQARFCWREIGDNGPGRVYRDDELAVLDKPWPNGTSGELLARMITDVDLCGNSFVANEGSRLRWLRPDWVSVVLTGDPLTDEVVDVFGYVYTPGGLSAETGVAYTPDDICHWSPIPSYASQYLGVSWMTAALRDIQGDQAATEHKLSFFRNGATLGPIVRLPATMSLEQFKEFVAAAEAAHTGAQNAYRTMYVGGGAEVSLAMADFKQLDLKAVQGGNETRIAALAGVHPTLVGLSEGLTGSSLNEGNFNAAKRSTTEMTLFALWQDACAALSAFVAVPDGSELWIRERDIPFLREAKRDQAEIMRTKILSFEAGIRAGLKADPLVDAIENDDFSLLKGAHTGLTSVQLLPPAPEQSAPVDFGALRREPIRADATVGPAIRAIEAYHDEDLVARALLAAFDEIERRYNPAQARVPRGFEGGGRFRNLADRLVSLLTDWAKGEGPDDPLDDFSRDQLRTTAKRLAEQARDAGDNDRAARLTPRRGASAEEIKLALYTDIRASVRGDRKPPEKAEAPKAARVPVKKAAPAKAAAQYDLAPGYKGPTARLRQKEREEVLVELGQRDDGMGTQAPGREEALGALEGMGYVRSAGGRWRLTDRGREYLDARETASGEKAAPAAKKAAPKGPRPSGLPRDRKPETGDFDDLADRITGKSEAEIGEILQDLNATELGRLVRKFPGTAMTVPGWNKTSERKQGLKIPDGLTLEQKREWLAWQLSGRARRDPANPPDFMVAKREAETATKERERAKKAPKTPDELTERLAANTTDAGTRIQILNAGPNPARLRALADEAERDARTARDPLDGRGLQQRAEYLREAADEIEAFTPPAKAAKKAVPRKAGVAAPRKAAKAAPDPQAREIEVENRIRAAYVAVLAKRGRTARPGDTQWVGLADLRDELGEGTSRDEIDQALRRMAIDDPGVNLVPESNQKMLRPVDREAAVVLGEQPKHALSIEDPTPRPVPPAGRPKAAEPAADKPDVLATTSAMLSEQVDTRGYIDVGVGVERHLGISRDKLDKAIDRLKEQGYEVHSVQVDQLTGKGKTTVKVLAPPGTSYADVKANRDKIRSIVGFSEDRGHSFEPIRAPLSVDSDRLAIRYADDGGAAADGVVYVRPGVEDLSLGGGRYAQVRIAVDGTHYIKGMAVYHDDLPDGVDLLFNTKKSDTGDKLDALKPLKRDPRTGEVDPDLPFGSTIRRQILEDDGEGGKRVASAMNLVYEEGSWSRWSRSLSAQVLSKQSPDLARGQLGLLRERKRGELDDILALAQPVVRRELLGEYAEGADSAAVDLAAAALPRQAWHVILPVDSLPETEVYAPGYRDGERVVLIRHPHGGTFEIPELVVNNANPQARRLLGDAPDAVGIHPTVAGRLSGADFDGDTVLVIPNESGQITTSPPLEGLADFDPIESYPAQPGTTPITAAAQQTQMGVVSNLITDMTIQGAPPGEIARAVRHSMVIIDARKHKLDYKRSATEHGITELKRRYQGGATKGAATLISKAGSRAPVPDRKPRSAAQGGPIDPATGQLVFEEPATWVDAQGRTRIRTRLMERLAATDDARTLLSPAATEIELIYAEHSNELKAMANEARRELVAIGNVRWDPAAKAAHAEQVATLKAKLDLALRNAPVERHAQIIAGAIVARKLAAEPDMSKADLARVKANALKEARARVGAGKTRVFITDREWEAIQAGALSDDLLTKILRNADPARVRALTTGR